MLRILLTIYFFIFDLFGVALPAVPSTVSGFDISHLVFSSGGSSVSSGFQDASRVTDSYAFGFTTVLNQLAVYHYTSCFDYQGGNYCIYTIYHHYGSATCATGTSPIDGYCIQTCSANQHLDANNICVDNTFAYFTGNKTGCHNFGGKYYSDGTCLSPNDFVHRLYKDPNSKLYGGLILGGMLLTPAGWFGGLAGLFSSSVGATLATAGLLSTGTGTYAVASSLAPDQKVSNDSASSGTSGAIRVDLIDYKLSDTPDAGGKTATVTDASTGKVKSATVIPTPVLEQMANTNNVNPDTQEFITPIDTTGMQEIEYNYENNVATVVTHTSPTARDTKQTSITVSQNSDGTVTTIPSQNIAPTVSGSNGGTVNNYNYTPATSTTSGSNPSTSVDNTAVLNDIKTNTKGISDSLNVDMSGLNSDVSDGSSALQGYVGDIEQSLGQFIYLDPMGLSNLGSGQNVPTYDFNLLGQHFVLFDENIFNSLPLALIKSILLFVAAISAFITVISFGG